MTDITVSIVGSFRKDRKKLESLFKEISSKFTLLSPLSIDFTNEEDGFVKTDAEVTKSIKQIEKKHLEAIKSSDFVVLHAPGGYVGLSGATEIGYAYALGIPIFADEKPTDKTIETFVSGFIDDIDPVSARHPGKALSALQEYYSRIATRRGWDKETPKDTILLMLEEIGELARAVRKVEGLKRDGEYVDAIEEELADVQLYLVHLASALNVDLGHAVTQKEVKNEARFKARR